MFLLNKEYGAAFRSPKVAHLCNQSSRRQNIRKNILVITPNLRPRSHKTGRIFVQIRLAFTRDTRKRTNSSTANRTNSRPKTIRSRFFWDRSQILTNPCEHRNRSFSGLICTVGNWNELDNAMKPGLSSKLTRSIDLLKTTTKM